MTAGGTAVFPEASVWTEAQRRREVVTLHGQGRCGQVEDEGLALFFSFSCLVLCL